MVLPEAASRGLLLVGSDHGGPREILEAGAIGELCDPFAAESIAAALRRTFALTDAEADARRIAADRSVRARFGAEVVGRQLEAFLNG
jgi:glycosyltransferase involved in cell wall biosynthesis